jgi:hypothetical protein
MPPYPSFDFGLDYDPAVPCVIMTWQGYANSAEFRAACERILAALVERKATKLLGDTTDFVLIGAEDQQWLSQDWIPRVIAAGLRHVAVLTPRFYFNRVAIESVGDCLDPHTLVLQRFEEREAARNWLVAV